MQYCASEVKNEPKTVAFLWTDEMTLKEDRIVVFGACFFRWRQYPDIGDRYTMQFIWLHPYKRREGHLEKAWPFFETCFGEFIPQLPLSDSMKNFLVKKTNHNDLRIKLGVEPFKCV